MKKYYDLYEEKICAILDWKPGCGTIEEARNHFKTDKVNEISLSQFKEVRDKYCGKKTDEDKEEKAEIKNSDKQLSLF